MTIDFGSVESLQLLTQSLGKVQASRPERILDPSRRQIGEMAKSKKRVVSVSEQIRQAVAKQNYTCAG